MAWYITLTGQDRINNQLWDLRKKILWTKRQEIASFDNKKLHKIGQVKSCFCQLLIHSVDHQASVTYGLLLNNIIIYTILGILNYIAIPLTLSVLAPTVASFQKLTLKVECLNIAVTTGWSSMLHSQIT